MKVDPVLGLFAYDDVVVRGGNLANAVATPLVQTDEGKLFGQATGKLSFDWGKGFRLTLKGSCEAAVGFLEPPAVLV